MAWWQEESAVVYVLDSCFGADIDDCLWFDSICRCSCSSVGFGKGVGEVLTGRQEDSKGCSGLVELFVQLAPVPDADTRRWSISSTVSSSEVMVYPRRPQLKPSGGALLSNTSHSSLQVSPIQQIVLSVALRSRDSRGTANPSCYME